jgi:hypothetical protein
MELFKKSFTSYVESGMRETVAIDIDILRNKQGEFSVTKDFQAKFRKFIVDHYLCKFHCFRLYLTHLNTETSLPNTAQPGESRAHAGGGESASASGESHQAREEQASQESVSRELRASASGGQAFELERMKGKKFTWLRKLMPKFHRRQRE